MPLPPLALPASPAVRIIGDVVVHPQAVLAPGVLLWAEAGATIRIAAGVCIGMGSVLHAHGGNITLAEGVNLGAGVLLIGAVTLEPHACIGTSATLMDTTVPAGAVVAAGSLLGDGSRRWQPVAEPSAPPPAASPEPPDPWQEKEPEPILPSEPAETETSTEQPPSSEAPVTPPAAKPTVVYGQTYVSQMFAKMFRTEPQGP